MRTLATAVCQTCHILTPTEPQKPNFFLGSFGIKIRYVWCRAIAKVLIFSFYTYQAPIVGGSSLLPPNILALGLTSHKPPQLFPRTLVTAYFTYFSVLECKNLVSSHLRLHWVSLRCSSKLPSRLWRGKPRPHPSIIIAPPVLKDLKVGKPPRQAPPLKFSASRRLWIMFNLLSKRLYLVLQIPKMWALSAEHVICTTMLAACSCTSHQSIKKTV